MPFTSRIDERYSVTVGSHGRTREGWETRGDIFATDTPERIVFTVRGEGPTQRLAEDRAAAAARTWCRARYLKRRAGRRPKRSPSR
ncbi:MAG: hypothetical protein B7Z08_01075 [Sphingomonadales bacterium 32-68-7]|nr:MAG: hypothetical protein B7Z33_03250 [Sphingomonadales bacterium 12-68-11]OYX10433.1 MAG: hypothetical protein B7Z08_01075 [Sphingomonadales bacterium 32-68-7]